ncbi:MAG: hypothetical protein KDA48_16525 [Amphiplicatus sp.]|nr:hypothetical protein [Amphiplicatus sp.]
MANENGGAFAARPLQSQSEAEIWNAPSSQNPSFSASGAKKSFHSLAVIDDVGNVHRFTGRTAWALRALIEAGERGCTPIDTPGPRWSHYVFCLRREGLDIETIAEAHGGPFAGHHARYVLRTLLRVLEKEAA